MEDSEARQTMRTKTEQTSRQKLEAEKNQERLRKRLCYLLRYGAMKEGLKVYDGGYVALDDAMKLHLMKWNREEEVMHEVKTSLSSRGTKRFQEMEKDGRTYIRAAYYRMFERNPCHEATNVPTLLETSLEFVTSNIEMYDLQNFPDEYLISSMIHRLKRKKKLNKRLLGQLLVPALEHLDLEGIILTESIFKLIWTQCPCLRVVSLKDCGYIVTDSLLEQIIRKLPELETLNLAACKHLTDKGLESISRYAKKLKQLNLSWIKGFSDESLVNMVLKCENLKHLDIYDLKISEESTTVLETIAKERGMVIVLKGLTSDVAPENPSILLHTFGKLSA
ncbi:hypothetical protein ACJMK2_012088 [Sinanodonta woodiana]|uniref:2'-phosphotransferase n=1 Tax=Sinanodonta woodiana TaxID=1069815 RepID=A0ABD3V725_SINWO